jgi:hypothetical protein
VNGERGSILGSAYKRLASLYARRVLRGDPGNPGDQMDRAIAWSRWFYVPKSADPTDPSPSYPSLNWLGLMALQTEPGSKEAEKHIDSARRFAEKARGDFAKQPGYWDAVGPADARVVEHILRGTTATVDDLEREYRHVFESVAVKPRERDSTMQQIKLLALLLRARAKLSPSTYASFEKVADDLCELLRRLEPDLCDAVVCPPAPPSRFAASAPIAEAKPKGSRRKRKRPKR